MCSTACSRMGWLSLLKGERESVASGAWRRERHRTCGWVPAIETLFEDGANAVLEFLVPGEILENDLVAALLGIAVKIEDDCVLRGKVIVGAAQSDFGLGGNVAHGPFVRILFDERVRARRRKSMRRVSSARVVP